MSIQIISLQFKISQDLSQDEQFSNIQQSYENQNLNTLTIDQLEENNDQISINDTSMITYEQNTKQYKIIQDSIFGPIQISLKLMKIVNSKEFQRLHQLRQNGTAYVVYPSSSHTRFNHSLGVYYLSTYLMNIMKERLVDFKENQESIQQYNTLCEYVQAASLLHDIGHGCYSHLFEQFTYENGISQNHEEIGKYICRRLLKRLGWEENEIKIIQALIDGNVAEIKEYFGKFHFLTLIVHNRVSNLDTDKIEYLLRDSFQVGIKISVDWQRILSNTELGLFKDKNNNMFYQFIYNNNIQYEITQIYESRLCLHTKLYQHVKIIAADMLVLDILKLINQLKLFNIIEYVKCVTNPNIQDFDYFIINDNLLEKMEYINQIQNKNQRLQELFDRLHQHKIYKSLLKYSFSSSDPNFNFKELQKKLLEQLMQVDESVRLCARTVDFGKKDDDPLKYIPLSRKIKSKRITEEYKNAIEKVYNIELNLDGWKMEQYKDNNCKPQIMQQHYIFIFSSIYDDKSQETQEKYDIIREKAKQIITSLENNNIKDSLIDDI